LLSALKGESGAAATGKGNTMPFEGKPRILVVDDDRFAQRLMQDMLVPLGYAVSVAGNGQEALEAARRNRPRLILLDVVMPVMDGFEACRQLKADPVTAHIPVVLVTSLEGRESKIRGLAVGASDFLAKPVDEAELALRVKNLLRVVEFEVFLQQHNEQLDAQVRERTHQLEAALEALRRSREELKTSYLDTIFRLTTVAEYKDGFTSGHIKRVGLYCRHLARELGWDEEQQESIYYASPMHDIGKVVIPTEILQKTAPLTDEEFAIVRGHTTAGARILQGSTSAFLQLAEIIALTHHERYDGGGYPRGLRGEELPLAGLIMSVADQYEALRSERPYKPALTHRQVVDIITRGDGRTEPSHFHPQVLAAFADSTQAFAAIFEQHAREQ
jgi:putative two-component system response regulator